MDPLFYNQYPPGSDKEEVKGSIHSRLLLSTNLQMQVRIFLVLFFLLYHSATIIIMKNYIQNIEKWTEFHGVKRRKKKFTLQCKTTLSLQWKVISLQCWRWRLFSLFHFIWYKTFWLVGHVDWTSMWHPIYIFSTSMVAPLSLNMSVQQTIFV